LASRIMQELRKAERSGKVVEDWVLGDSGFWGEAIDVDVDGVASGAVWC
jgi:hypothetical protein